MLAVHATPQPVKMIADALLDSKVCADIVLDLFIGSGSPLVAADKAGRVCYGMDLDPLFVDASIPRHTWTGLEAGHVASGRTFAELEAERVVQDAPVVEDAFMSAAIQRGCATEAEARDAYRLMADAEVDEVGFVGHPNITMSGASPDRLIGTDGLHRDQVPEYEHPHRDAASRENTGQISDADPVAVGLHGPSLVRLRLL